MTFFIGILENGPLDLERGEFDTRNRKIVCEAGEFDTHNRETVCDNVIDNMCEVWGV